MSPDERRAYVAGFDLVADERDELTKYGPDYLRSAAETIARVLNADSPIVSGFTAALRLLAVEVEEGKETTAA